MEKTFDDIPESEITRDSLSFYFQYPLANEDLNNKQNFWQFKEGRNNVIVLCSFQPTNSDHTVFDNHRMKNIWIKASPLEAMKIIEFTDCNFYFGSQESLLWHRDPLNPLNFYEEIPFREYRFGDLYHILNKIYGKVKI